MRKLFVLQFNDDTAMQYAIIEYKVGVVILVINNDSLLASLKAEAFASFEDKLLKMTYQRIFQIVLIHCFLRFQSEKLKSERLTNL